MKLVRLGTLLAFAASLFRPDAFALPAESARLADALALSGERRTAFESAWNEAAPEIDRLWAERLEGIRKGTREALDAMAARSGYEKVAAWKRRGAEIKKAAASMKTRALELEAARDRKLLAGLDQKQKKVFEDLARFRAEARNVREVEVYLEQVGAVARGRENEWVEMSARLKEGLAKRWTDALLAKDMKALEALAAPGYESSAWAELSDPREDGMTREWTIGFTRWLPRREALADLERLLARFDKIEAVDLDLLGLEPIADRALHRGRLSVRGSEAGTGRRLEMAGSIEIETDGKRLMRTRLHGGTLIAALRDAPLFANKTAAAGLDAVPVRLRSEAIRRGGYALALCDVNGDKYPDLYVGASGEGQLLLNDGRGGFTDATAASGLRADDHMVKSAVFADFNNDGREDLLLMRFEYSPKKQMTLYEGLGEGRFAHNARFDFSGFAKYNYSLPMPMALGDFNRDQKLDFYVGFPGKLDFTTLSIEETSVAMDRRNRPTGHPQGLFLNAGNFRFEDKTEYALYKSDVNYTRKMKTAALFPHSAVAADLDNDRDLDLLVVDDRRNPSPLFRNKGDGTFEQVAERVGVDNPQAGMSAAIGDYDNDGNQDIYMTNVHFREEFIGARGAWLMGDERRESGYTGNRLYRNLGEGLFEDVTDKAGLRYAGEAPGGATFVDYDNDGDMDLYVVNGLWSSPGSESYTPKYRAALRGLALVKSGAQGFGLSADSTPLSDMYEQLSIVGDGQSVMRILRTATDDSGGPRYSLGGGQRNRLYRNNADGTFTDVSYAAGVDSLSDGYVAAAADVNRDGRMDLVLRNADPGTPGLTFPAVELFENQAAPERKFLTLSLRGTESQSDAFGAKAWATVADRQRMRELIANNGAAQDEKILHFGLGGEEKAQKLTVLWPSGKTQEFRDVAAGHYELTEGAELRRSSPAVTARLVP
jgi:hypothetical protein